MEKQVYEYPEKHPKNCDLCNQEKTMETNWDNDGCKYITIYCIVGYVSYENGKRDFIDAVGCPLFKE